MGLLPPPCDAFKYSKSLYFHNCKNVSPEFRGLRRVSLWFEAFCGARYPEGGRCIGCDTVYCCEKSEECAEKGMTQNSKHNRFLSAPAGQRRFLFFHAPVFPWWRQLSKNSLGVCVCVWAGVAWSLFIPSSQLTHEVMVVTLSVGSAALIPFVLGRSFTDASGVLMMESDGMRACVRAEPLFMPSSDGL